MDSAQDSLRVFALEAERQYRRLGELARSLGIERASAQLFERAEHMRTMLDQGQPEPQAPRPSVLGEAADELYVLGEEIHNRLSGWPPASLAELAELVDFVAARSERLKHLVGLERRAARGLVPESASPARLRWGQETPAAEEPPQFATRAQAAPPEAPAAPAQPTSEPRSLFKKPPPGHIPL